MNQLIFEFKTPDEIPLSWRCSKTGQVLHHLAYRLCGEWSVRFADQIRQARGYERLSCQYNSTCADLLVEKTLFMQLLPIAMAYVRIHEFINYKQECHRTIDILDGDLVELFSSITLEHNICIKKAVFAKRFVWILKNQVIKVISYLRYYSFKTKKEVCNEPKGIGCEIEEGLLPGCTRSELQWWDGLRPEATRVVGYINSPVASDQLPYLDELKEKGAKFYRNSFKVSGGDCAYKDIAILQRPIRYTSMCLLSEKGKDRWIKKRLSSWRMMISWWCHFFYLNNIKIWISLDEAGLDSVVQRAAIEKLEGLTVYRQRSIYPVPTVAYNAAHVAFTWHVTMASYLANSRNRNKAVLTIGHAFGVHENLQFKYSKTIREKILATGAKYVIAVMDNMAGPDLEISSDQLNSFYEALFHWQKNHSDVCILIKKKKKAAQPPPLTDRDTYRNNKIVVIDEIERMLPAAVIAEVDLTIGINLSSAAVESLLMKKQTVFYYPSSSGFNELDRKYKDRIVFDNVQDLMLFVSKTYSGDRESEHVLEDAAGLVDSYRDGNGPRRMQAILLKLLYDDDGVDELDASSIFTWRQLKSLPNN